jgi:nitrite reductase/ring-hydroxylating ferredoxin subunit
MTPFHIRRRIKDFARRLLGLAPSERPEPPPPPRYTAPPPPRAEAGPAPVPPRPPPPRPAAPAPPSAAGPEPPAAGPAAAKASAKGKSPKSKKKSPGSTGGNGEASAEAAPAGASDAAPATAGGATWVQVARIAADELAPGSVRAVDVFGVRYAVYNVDGALFASSEACPHAGGPLGDGELEGSVVTCPLHGYSFDVKDGRCTSGAPIELDRVPIKVKDNKILLQVTT